MFITFLVFVVILLLTVGGLALNLFLYKRGVLHRVRQDYSESSTDRLHAMLFQ